MWKFILRSTRVSIMMLVFFSIILGALYPLLITGIAKTFFPYKSEGSLIIVNDKIIGSELIGQQFKNEKYFFSRLALDASDEKITNKKRSYKAALERAKEKFGITSIPGDLVTHSASGVDPDITLDAAFFQIPRIAKIRALDEIKLKQLILKYAVFPPFKLFGEPTVNVLILNLALDKRDF